MTTPTEDKEHWRQERKGSSRVMSKPLPVKDWESFAAITDPGNAQNENSGL